MIDAKTPDGGDETPRSGADGPVVPRVTATGRLRGGDVVVRYPRRTLGQLFRGESAIRTA